jgi:SAM-dependent methyltransferase
MGELDAMDIPSGPYSFAISIQALHEIPHPEKRKVMKAIYDLLVPGGTFYLMDRVEFDGEALSASYQSVWNRLVRKASLQEPLSYVDYWSTYRGKDDHVATLEEQLSWLRAAGFHAACLYLHYNRALFAAKRPEVPSNATQN